MTTDPLPVVVCLKWGVGYPAIYTNTLFRAVSDHMSIPFRFVCITDDPTGLEDDIETREIPYFAMDRKDWTRGMWPKFAICAPGMFENGTPVLYLDVDVLVNSDLAPLFARVREHGGLHVRQDWQMTHERWFPNVFKHKRITHGAVIGMIAGEQDHLYDMVKDRDIGILKEFYNDQVLFHYRAANHQYLPKEWVLSFKKSLAWHAPISLFKSPSRPPSDCMVVSFHGNPNPQDLMQPAFKRWGTAEKFGYFPVKWMRAYWNKYSRATD